MWLSQECLDQLFKLAVGTLVCVPVSWEVISNKQDAREYGDMDTSLTNAAYCTVEVRTKTRVIRYRRGNPSGSATPRRLRGARQETPSREPRDADDSRDIC